MKAKKHLDAIVRWGIPYLNRISQVRLDRNERVSCWSEETRNQIREIISPEVIMSYPEIEPLYEKLAAALDLSRKQLLLSHGSDAALKSIFEVYAGPEDEAVMLTPSYAMYPVYAQMVGAKAVEVNFQEDLSLPFESVLNAVSDRTRIVCLPNPNQPIERIFSKEELGTILRLSLEKDFLIVVDEAYYYFYPETVIYNIDKNPNLIVTRTFSKAFGMAGLRAGLLISNENRISDLKKVKPISEINNVAAKLIEFFLGRMELVHSYVNEVNLGRQTVIRRAQKCGISTHGETGNSILLQLRDADEVRSVVAKARQQGYLIKGPFAHPATRHLRITLGPKNLMEEVMDIVEEELNARKL